MSTEERLVALYKLQTILSEIDRIRTIRGELPIEVSDLEDHIEGLKTRLANIKAEMDAIKKATLDENNKIADSKAKIEKYDEQIKSVRHLRGARCRRYDVETARRKFYRCHACSIRLCRRDKHTCHVEHAQHFTG